MKVYGFVGPSGTGKSYRALEVAKRYSVSCILDDGLLIRENQVLAGTSAKREASRIASIRRALFTEPAHAEAVRNALDATDAESVMILGTSVHMVDSITNRLSLPPISTYIDISEVASPGDIEAARAVRMDEGKHVIPAPTFALKKDFSGYFLAPLRRLVERGIRPGRNTTAMTYNQPAGVQSAGAQGAGVYGTGAVNVGDIGERTVVRPTFSYLGGYTISRAALEQLVSHIALKCDGVARVIDASVDYTDNGLDIGLSLGVLYGVKIHNALNAAVIRLRMEVDRQTSLHIRGVRLVAKSLEDERK